MELQMSDRDATIRAFLNSAGWGKAAVAPLAGDASNRRYLRLDLAGQPAVLMDAPADEDEDVRPFILIDNYLTGIGLSAPRILAADATQGLLLLEDLGDDLFARVIPRQPELESSLYSCATDLLAELHDHSPPSDLSTYSVPVMVEKAALSYDWYLSGTNRMDEEAKATFSSAIADCLAEHAADHSVLIQRDYHSENLLWLPHRTGVARTGLLDFQDAKKGHRAYDLVSLLQDARRDVPPVIEAQMIARYIAATGQDASAFDAAYHVLGAQRNLRIVGVFARLCLRDGKAHYVDLIPRVWNLLQRDLAHPALADVAQIVNASLPAPTPSLLQGLKDKCATIPIR